MWRTRGMAHNDNAPALLPEKFDGNQNFDHWVSHFETVSEINKWNDMEKLLWLHVSMKGKAYVAYECLAYETRQRYQTVRDALQERFEPLNKAELYKIEFNNREKKMEEDWADYADDLLTLVRKAFPSLDERSLEQIALDKYMSNLCDPNISFEVKKRRPQTLREAVHVTIELNTYLLAINKTHKDSDKVELSQNSSTNIATQNFNNDIVDLLKHVEAISQTLSKHQEVLAQKPRTCKPVSCYRCGEVGHYARGCAT